MRVRSFRASTCDCPSGVARGPFERCGARGRRGFGARRCRRRPRPVVAVRRRSRRRLCWRSSRSTRPAASRAPMRARRWGASAVGAARCVEVDVVVVRVRSDAVVDRPMERALWPSERPSGRRLRARRGIRVERGRRPACRVVGVGLAGRAVVGPGTAWAPSRPRASVG